MVELNGAYCIVTKLVATRLLEGMWGNKGSIYIAHWSGSRTHLTDLDTRYYVPNVQILQVEVGDSCRKLCSTLSISSAV